MRLTTEQLLTTTEVSTLHSLYLTAFRPLVTQAAARHVLTRAEFEDEVNDPRVDKIVVRDDDGEVVGITTLTRELTTLPWVNPDFFRARYPDVWDRSSVFYVGYVLVDPARRNSDALVMMADEINERVSQASGVLAFDICAFNDTYGVGRRIAEIFHPATAIDAVDTQTYYVADYRAAADRRPAADSAPLVGGALTDGTLEDRPTLAAGLHTLVGELAAVGPRAPADDGRPSRLQRTLEQVPASQVVIVADAVRLRGAALWLPIVWDGGEGDAPRDWLDAYRRGRQALAGRGRPTAAVVLPLLPEADLASAECTAALVAAVRRAVATRDLAASFVLVRPASKRRYPMVAMRDYLRWKDGSGKPFDTGLRLHADLGAQTARAAAGAERTAGRAEWEVSLGMPLPGDGTYVIDSGLAPLVVQNGLGRYREPRAWMRYERDGSTPRDGWSAQSSHSAVT